MNNTLLLGRGALTLALLACCLLGRPPATHAQLIGVRAWGWNAYGQLGNGANTDSNVPVAVSGLPLVTADVAGGAYHSLARISNGTVRAWGDNSYGQLGNGTFIGSSVPVNVSGLSNVVAIAAGGVHSLALLADGTVRSWGDNSYGQLGNGTFAGSSVPVNVSGLSNVVAIAAGGYHSLALLADGTVRSWGWNSSGQLGNSTFTTSNVPVTVSNLAGVKAIAAGGHHSLALLLPAYGGGVRAWGYNGYGQLGDGSTTNSNVPVATSALANMAAVSAGYYHSLALRGNGTVAGWGYNFYGQLGNGSNSNSNVPVDVLNLTNVASIASGSSSFHSLALRTDNTVRAWGYNSSGQLGNGTNTDSNVPVTVSGLTGPILRIAAGGYHSLATRLALRLP